MQIKKFEANNMKEALCQIKNEFGPDAVILSVRKVENNKSNFMFPKNYGVEVTAANDEKDIDRKAIIGRGNISRYQFNQNNRDPLNQVGRKKGIIGNFRRGIRQDDMKNGSLSFKNRENNRDSKELYASYQQMIEHDVDREIARELIKDAANIGLSDPCLYKIGFKSSLIQLLETKGITASRVKINKDTPNIIIAIGPTGVGKTTTIAKLAAAAKTGPRKKNVAIITTDDNRIGAIEQLKVYSRIIGVPFRAASTKNEISEYLECFKNADLILIDTPGVTPKNQMQINNFRNLFSKIGNAEYHLVLSAATNEKTLRDVMEKYRVLNIKRMIFTKLDECITYGSILNQLYRSKIPASYFTNGQNVPQDIEAASIEKLTDLVLNDVDKKKYLAGPPELLANNIIRFENIIQGKDEEYGRSDYNIDSDHDYFAITNRSDNKLSSNFRQ